MSQETIHLPFSPISWRLRKDESIICRLKSHEMNEIWKEESINSICFNGLFDTLISLSLFEWGQQNRIFRKNSIVCNKQFKDVVDLQGLASIDNSINENELIKYPAPLIGLNNKYYYNLSYNKESHLNYKGEILNKQNYLNYCLVINNLLFEWKPKFIPVLRNLNWDLKLDQWAKSNNIKLNNGFVLILPDRMNISSNDISFLGWELPHIKSLTAMLSTKGINTVVMSNRNFYHSGLNFIDYSLSNFLNLAKYAKIILADELDFLALGVLYSNAIIAANKYSYRFSVDKIKNWCQRENAILSSPNLSPIEIFNLNI